MKTGDEVSEIASRIGVSIDEVAVKILKSLGTHQPQECSDTSLPGKKQNHRRKSRAKPAKNYNLVEPYGTGKSEVYCSKKATV